MPFPGAIDCHVHAWSGPPRVAVATGLPAKPVPLAVLVGVWRANAVAGGVVVQPSWLGTDNSELADALTRSSLPIRGVAVLDPLTTGSDTVAALDRLGVRAIRFNTISSGPLPDLSAGGWPDLLSAIARHGWHIEALAAPPGFAVMAGQLADLGLPLVFDHFATPDAGYEGLAGRVRLLSRIASRVRVDVKLSAPYVCAGVDHTSAARALADALGPDHLVLGSNFPFPRHETSRTYAREWSAITAIAEAAGLAPGDMADNARRLYRFERTPPTD
jgi:predicted TIM-barrel fold metal-dependent hydrolase